MPGLAPAAQQRGDRGEQPVAALRERVAAGGDHRAQRLGHAALGRHVVDEAVHPGAQRRVRRQVGAAVGDGVAEPGELVAVRRLDQRLAGGEVPVERADADAGVLGDRVERDVGAVLGERAHGDLEQPVAVALGVGAQRPALDGAPHVALASRCNRRLLRLVSRAYRRILRFAWYADVPPQPAIRGHMTASTPITTPFTADVHRRRGHRRHRPHRPARHRHRRRVRHRRRDRPRAGRRRRRGHPRRPQHRGRASAPPRDIIATTGNKQVHVAPLDLADRASVARVRRRLGRPAAHPGQQRRRHGVAADAHARGLGDAVRHQPPRPLRAGHRPAPALAAAGGARVVVGQLQRPPALAGRLRGHPLRATATTSRGSAYGQSKTANVLFAVEATRRWADDGITVNALHAGRDPDQPAALRHRRGARPAARAAGGGGADAGRRRSRARRPRSWSRPRRCSTASAAATSRTATRPRSTGPAPAAASPRTRSTRRPPPGSGRVGVTLAR